MKTSNKTSQLFASKIFFSLKTGVFCLLIFISSFQISRAQQYSADWGKYLNDPLPPANFIDYDEISEQIVVDVKNASTNEEYVYVVGQDYALNNSSIACLSANFYYGSQDVTLTKYNQCGDLIWQRHLSSDDNTTPHCGDQGLCIALDREGGNTYIYIAGYSFTNGAPCDAGHSRIAFFCSLLGCPPFQSTKQSGTDGFIAKYDESGNLKIWTYFGGTGNEYIYGIDVFDHRVFITGYTESPTLGFIPAGTPVFDDTQAGAGDVFVAELEDGLCNLVFFSLMGGISNDRGHSIKVFQMTGLPVSFYLSGSTSNEMSDPVLSYNPKNSFTPGIGGGDSWNDAFISLWQDQSGTGLFTPTWLRYLGGSKADRGRDMVLAPTTSGFFMIDVVLTGFTKSTDLIAINTWLYPTSSFYHPAFHGGMGGTDGFVAKFNLGGDGVWGTYFGGNGDDHTRGVARYSVTTPNPINYIVIAGGTKSPNLLTVNPTPPNHLQFQNALNGGMNTSSRDAYLAVLTDPPNANTHQDLDFVTYYGGKKNEWDHIIDQYGPSVALGGNKEIYLTFFTSSKDITDYITSPGYHSNTKSFDTNSDGFLAKILNSSISGQGNCSTFGWRVEDSVNDQFSISPDNKLLLYPNPAMNNVTMAMETQGNAFYQVLNIYGEILLNGNLDAYSSTYSIDISALASGIYIVKCSVSGQSLVQRFTVAK